MIERALIAEPMFCAYRVGGRSCRRRARAWVRIRLPFIAVPHDPVYQEAALCPEHERALAETLHSDAVVLSEAIEREPSAGVRRVS